ncbi:beta-1 adrenergic receptor-like isoform X2 [Ylistrum balloti]|uniref:beta-1 adrenergic receptor-like isoform X2 n=1 Tax=Ylistrum balloti TaxID=509963 RepID=UPI002905BC7D|nr:beta-1 adrenergic receptor-like isoform X2 [Ylistrum balloti]
MANRSSRIVGGAGDAGGGVTMLPFPAFSDVIYTTMEGLNITNVTDSGNATRTRKMFSLVEQIFFGTWLSISMILAIFGNLMVIAVVVRHRGMRTRTNMFLVSLAVADFLIGILLAPFSLATLIAQDWILGPSLCTINSFLNATCFITSIHTLMHISIHKYMSITRPLTRITKCKILVMIFAAWGWGVVCAALTTVILSHAEFKEGTMQCGPAYPVLTTKSLLFHIIIQTSNIFLPLFIMIYAYSRMFGEIREHMQRMDENTAMDRAQIYSQQRRVTITLFIVLACFVLCWIPYCVYANYVTFEPDKTKFPPYLNAIAYCFGYMNSACNPIIYAWRSPSFREGYKEILCQEPSYVVSDDTVYESSPNPLRRISTFISSVRGSRSEEMGPNTTRGNHIVRQTSTDSSYKLLHKLTGKTKAKSGSSVIRRDGSVILVKNGKIISMKLDTKLRKSDNEEVFLSSPSTAGSNGSRLMCSSPQSALEVLYERDSDGNLTEDRPLFPNGQSNNKNVQFLYPNGGSNTCNSLSDNSDCESIPGKEISPGLKCRVSDISQDVDIEMNKIPEKTIDENNSLNNNTETKSPAEKKKLSLLPWTKGHVKRKSDTTPYVKATPKVKYSREYSRSSDAIFSVPLLKTPSAEEVTASPLLFRRSSSYSNVSTVLSPSSCRPLSALSPDPNKPDCFS